MSAGAVARRGAYNNSFQITRGGDSGDGITYHGSCREGDEVTPQKERTITKEKPGDSGSKWARTQQGWDEHGSSRLELDPMMDNAGAPRHRTYGGSSFSADEWVEAGKPRDGPEQWPEWKQENDRAYQQYLDEGF